MASQYCLREMYAPNTTLLLGPLAYRMFAQLAL